MEILKIPKLQSKCKKQLSLGFLIQTNEKDIHFSPKNMDNTLILIHHSNRPLFAYF